MAAAHAQGPLHVTPQWIVVLLVALADGRTDKIPCDYGTARTHVDAHDPKHWTDYTRAVTTAHAWGPQFTVGFVLTAADPFWCLDIDNALQPDGAWSALSVQLCQALPGTCVELSQSGRGLHIWGQGPVPKHTMKRVDLGIELYTERRFIAIGTQPVGDMRHPCPSIAQVAAAYFPPRETAHAAPEEGPSPEWRGPTSDEELLRRAMQSRSTANVFGGGKASFADLYTADADALARAYPSDGGGYDASSADAALAQHLAFWTGRDVARIERLMRGSALAREKWDQRDDYLVERTIKGACGMQREVLVDKPKAAPEALAAPGAPPMPRITAVEGTTFLGPNEQMKLFDGCVYVVEAHKVLVPGGKLLKPENFKAKFGGYTFAMDARNERTTRNAFEALTESQVIRCVKVDETCFKPRLPYGEIVRDAGRVRVNTWWPVTVPRLKGDPTPFLQHLSKLLPVQRDRDIALANLAACVQYQGYKFPWAIVLQGVEGNGKTILSQCVAFAVGKRYVRWPRASGLNNKFNAWMVGSVLYCVEDIFTKENVDVIEQLKPMITGGDGLEVEGKGADQISAEVCGNFIFNTNHATGIKKTRNDRRFCWLATAQQSLEHLARDGLTEAYFLALARWLEADGYPIVADLLWTYPIPDELNPAIGCPRAPRTSTTEAAIEASLGRAEQEVLAAAERGDVGFAGGWISSIMVDKLLERHRLEREVMPKQRGAMVEALGYTLHPSLASTKGQVHHAVVPDGGKPKLYVRKGHMALAILKAADVGRAYSDAQKPS